MSESQIYFLNASGDIQVNSGLDDSRLEILQEVYERLSQYPFFPTICSIASSEVMKKGFMKRRGRFYTDLPDDLRFIPSRNYRGHAWNMDGNKIVDLTAFQFNPFLYEDSRLPEGIIIIEPGNRSYSRYISNANFKKMFGER